MRCSFPSLLFKVKYQTLILQFAITILFITFITGLINKDELRLALTFLAKREVDEKQIYEKQIEAFFRSIHVQSEGKKENSDDNGIEGHTEITFEEFVRFFASYNACKDKVLVSKVEALLARLGVKLTKEEVELLIEEAPTYEAENAKIDVLNFFGETSCS